MADHVELRRGAYFDSVSLMQVSRQVAGTAGVTAAQVAMARQSLGADARYASTIDELGGKHQTPGQGQSARRARQIVRQPESRHHGVEIEADAYVP